jgi:hypothetical protein
MFKVIGDQIYCEGELVAFINPKAYATSALTFIDALETALSPDDVDDMAYNEYNRGHEEGYTKASSLNAFGDEDALEKEYTNGYEAGYADKIRNQTIELDYWKDAYRKALVLVEHLRDPKREAA